jgi:hypothetical protein
MRLGHLDYEVFGLILLDRRSALPGCMHTASLLIAATIVNSLSAAIQILVRERSRATAAAVGRLFLNLIGLGLGPLAIDSSRDHPAISLGMAQGLR